MWSRRRQTYIHKFYQRDGILPDCKKIKKNPGLKALAKLMLNSLGGKFGQRENLEQTTFVSSSQELVTTLSNPSITTKDILPINDDVLLEIQSRLHNTILKSKRGESFVCYSTSLTLFIPRNSRWKSRLRGNRLSDIYSKAWGKWNWRLSWGFNRRSYRIWWRMIFKKLWVLSSRSREWSY